MITEQTARQWAELLAAAGYQGITVERMEAGNWAVDYRHNGKMYRVYRLKDVRVLVGRA